MSLLHWQSVNRMGGSLEITAADLCSLSVSPRVRKFGTEMVLAAEGTKFAEFQPFRHRLLILHAGVILPLALGAL